MLERRRLLLAIVLALLPYGLLAWRFDFVSDDAFISFRYSRYLAEGHGLVFNLGRPPVEGYSNFLWVVYLALFERIGVDITVAARVTSAFAGALLLALVTTVATRRLGLGFAGALATGLFVGALPPMGLWATSGLETMPTTLFVFGTFAALLANPARPRVGLAAVCALAATLLRADGIGFVGLVLIAGLVLWQREGRPRTLLRALFITGGVAALGLAALVAWRYGYYGELVPNTARVKAGFSEWRLVRGVYYVASYALTLPALVLVVLLALRRWPPGTARVWLPAFVLIGGTLGYAIWVGGDFMPFGRFLLPAVPFVALLFAGVWRGFERLRPLALTFAALCIVASLLAAFDVNVVPESVRRRPHFRADRAWQSEVERWRDMELNTARWTLEGRALAMHTRGGESIILGGMGAIAYHTELVVFDTYGLVTPEVLESAKPRAGASPGHDLRVDEGELFRFEPTYLGAFLTPVPPPADGVMPWWANALPAGWERHPWSALVRAEVMPLPANGEFPPGAHLTLLRFVREE